MSKRRTLIRNAAVGAAAAVMLVVGIAEARQFLKRYRVRRLSDALTIASPPFSVDADGPDCELFEGVPEILGDGFDPGAFDEIDMAGNGRLVAYASSATPASIGVRAIVVLKEGDDAEIVAEATGDDDQPAIAFDAFGWRMAFRGAESTDDPAATNVYLHTLTRATGGTGDDPEAPPPSDSSDTVNLSDVDTAMGEFARDPSIAARTRTRDIRSGVKVKERDARVAFVSNADIDKRGFGRNADVEGRNAENVEQVFLWREQDRRFLQLTRNDDPSATMARTTMSGNARFVAFESDGDLTPDAANPRDPSQVGNPNGVRQIFLWRDTRRGGRLEQLTWSDGDCLAPRMTRDGRFVFFCSRGDPLPGGNPEGNFEIFRWRRRASPARSLAQLTQTTSGHSVLPRPLRSARRFVFYSTASPPIGDLPFGGSNAQCGPTALLWSGGKVRLVAGLLDIENAALIGDGEPPVLTGPPAAVSVTKVHFASNDPAFAPPDVPSTAEFPLFYMARATRYPRR